VLPELQGLAQSSGHMLVGPICAQTQTRTRTITMFFKSDAILDYDYILIGESNG
jgi:hypothetical protein